jgi:hypothetical protein
VCAGSAEQAQSESDDSVGIVGPSTTSASSKALFSIGDCAKLRACFKTMIESSAPISQSSILNALKDPSYECLKKFSIAQLINRIKYTNDV